MDAMNRQKSSSFGRQIGGDGYPDCMWGHNLFRKYFLGKNLFDPVHAINPNGNFHAQGLANQITNGWNLIGMEMNGHQQ